MGGRLWREASVGVLAAALAGCATAPPATPPAPDRIPARPPVARPAAPPLDALAREQQTLARSLAGTPAVVVLDDDGALWLETPAARAFAPGQATLQPAFAVVLDQAAASLGRIAAARVVVFVPGERGASPVLSDRRGAQVRVHLTRRGVASARITTVAAGDTADLRLRMAIGDRGPLP